MNPCYSGSKTYFYRFDVLCRFWMLQMGTSEPVPTVPSQTTSTLQHVRYKQLQSIFVVFFLFRLLAFSSQFVRQLYGEQILSHSAYRWIHEWFLSGPSEVMWVEWDFVSVRMLSEYEVARHAYCIPSTPRWPNAIIFIQINWIKYWRKWYL